MINVTIIIIINQNYYQGEHPNNRGTILLADLFSKQINEWTNYSSSFVNDSWSTINVVYILINLGFVLAICSFLFASKFSRPNDTKINQTSTSRSK